MVRDDQRTLATYERSARALARYHDKYDRKGDVERAFALLGRSADMVVELGCGGGRDVKHIAEHAGRYLGIDYSTAMIEVARDENQWLTNAQFSVGDMRRLLLYPCDIIFALACLQHLSPDEIRELLRQSSKVLPIGGVFYLSAKLGEGSSWKHDEHGSRHQFFYLPNQLEDWSRYWFESAWLDTYAQNGQGWFSMALRRRAA